MVGPGLGGVYVGRALSGCFVRKGCCGLGEGMVAWASGGKEVGLPGAYVGCGIDGLC